MKKGFTLIELLAVIIVVSVVAMITVSVINPMIETAKERTFLNNVRTIEKAAAQYVLDKEIVLPTEEGQTYEILFSQLTPYLDNLKDPRDNSKIDGKVTVTRVNKQYKYDFVRGGTTASLTSNDWISSVPVSPKDFGRNLLVDSAKEVTSANEYVGIPLVNLLGKYAETGTKITISLDVKTSQAGALSIYTLGKYEVRNRVNNFGFDGSTGGGVTLTNTAYRRVSFTFDIAYNPLGYNGDNFNLSIYGTYGSGRIPTVKNIMITLDQSVTNWAPAPEDNDFNDTYLTSASLDGFTYKPQVYGEYTKLEVGTNPFGKQDKLIRNTSYSTNLFNNATGTLGNNTNFTAFTYTTHDAYGAVGSFQDLAFTTTRISNDLIPVNPNRHYTLSYYAKAEPYVGARYYFGLAPHDRDGNSISSNHYMYIPGTLTTLAQDLKPGDTIAYFTSLAGWSVDQAQTYQRRFIFWNYRDSTNYLYPPETYSRNVSISDVFDNTGKDLANNRITLRAPWTGSLIPAGTPVSANNQGAGYMYTVASNLIVPNTWTKYQGTITGYTPNGSSASSTFPQGTAYVKALFLNNRTTAGGGVLISNASLRETRQISASDKAGIEIGAVDNNRIPISSSNNYRFSVWVKTNSPKAAMGLLINTYAGQTGPAEAITRVDGTGQTVNPVDVVAVKDEWVLLTSYLYNASASSPTTALAFAHQLDGNVIKSVKGFKMKPTSTHLSYSLSIFDNNKDVYLYRPRMDLLDGNEPTVEELVKGIE